MNKVSNLFLYGHDLKHVLSRRYLSNRLSRPRSNAVVMSDDSKLVVCYHPEAQHPFALTKPIEHKVESNTILKKEFANLQIKRFDTKPAVNPQEHWADAQRLSQTFTEHPIIFKRPNRQERIKNYLERVMPIRKNRESI